MTADSDYAALLRHWLSSENEPCGSPRQAQWVDIGPTGAETPRRGGRWARGPLPKTFWVLPDDGGPPTLIKVVHKRERSRGGLGRWMDPGEAYSDAALRHLASLKPVVRDGWGGKLPGVVLQRADGVERAIPAPWRRRIGPVEPLPQDVYNSLSREA